MRTRLSFRYALAAGLGIIAVLFCSQAWSAGEWEWTAGQGWIQGAGVSRPTPKEQLHYAYEVEQRGEFMDAARQYFLLVQNFPASQEAGVGLQRLARCLFEMENYWTSYRAIEQVIESYPNTGRMSDLVEIELRIAKKLMVSQTPDILSGNEANNRDFNIRRALQIIDSVIEHDPYGPVAAEAYLVKGEGHLFVNEINEARTAFEMIRDEFPRSNYLERASLGILTCDSLVGNARQAEVQEQMEVVREQERELAGRYGEDDEDDVESFIRTTNEIEAAKMMEQANQYHQMGTPQGRKAAKFLLEEIVRRYPDTPQGEEARERAGVVRIPREQNRIVKAVKGINLNPFTYNKDPEPPWVVPQLAPRDMVMVDQGLGPMLGVPETGLPQTEYSATVRPAGIGDAELAMAGPVGFSPAFDGPTRAPEFIDGSASATRIVSSQPAPLPGQPAGPSSFGGMPALPPPGTPASRPIASMPESDLIMPPGGLPLPGAGGFASTALAPLPAPASPTPAARPPQPVAPPSLGSPVQNIPYTDLVGLPPGGRTYVEPPLPDFTPGYTTPAQPYNSADYGAPSQGYGANGHQASSGGYSQPPSFPVPAPPVPPSRSGYGGYDGYEGWTLGDDFR